MSSMRLVSIPLRKFRKKDVFGNTPEALVGFHPSKEVSEVRSRGFGAGEEMVSIPLRKFRKPSRASETEGPPQSFHPSKEVSEDGSAPSRSHRNTGFHPSKEVSEAHSSAWMERANLVSIPLRKFRKILKSLFWRAFPTSFHPSKEVSEVIVV